MKRSTWTIAGLLVISGLLLLLAAGLGLHSRSMMGMMGPGSAMMSMGGMMWTLRLWGVFVLFILFAVLAGLFIVCYRLLNHGSTTCTNCHHSIQDEWEFCPYCGTKQPH
ncbi:zinc ribbon domain-containing protein [Alicyclobacillus sp. SO9]|uniref:zinc ribbon domain-containing protein n=1 Tax=Alicyclobacillus sp. SO9 TaxID=2665646 RepID=UPI0018E8151E|nr:zinc ribbon domain-containing protein [Alicyclobacillus sp. SO9]QQE79808.1 zinc ribbon domain-containing protein [Alicyclobacillus sp. SO9]